MKKYRASLAVSIPHNFEIDLEASSEFEAYEKAVEAFDTGMVEIFLKYHALNRF